MRPSVLASAIVAPVLMGVGIFWLSLGYFHAAEITKAEGRLSLFHSSVTAELERFSHLTYILARDPFVLDTANGGATTELSVRLADADPDNVNYRKF